MKKANIEMLLLLSNIRDRKQIVDFCRELKVLEAKQVESLLTRLEEHKARTFAVASEAIEEELEQQRADVERERAERARSKAEADAERARDREIAGTVKEVSHLLLTRYKLKVPQAAIELIRELAKKGYRAEFKGEPKKPDFADWVRNLCGQIPKDVLTSAALNVNR